MNNPIQKKTGKAIKWYGIEVFGKQLLQIGITILLARLLEPEDFGLIGMVYIFVLVSSVIVDGGFAAALVYKKNIDSADKSTVFYTNIIISLLLYLLIFIFSESIASFYNQPQLKTIVRWLGLSIILASFNIVHYAMYSRKMNFKTPAKINLLALVI
ncbi:MAG: lipopolysaccharide biosynthesis protein, partial [Bacteroidetes bacterium]